jgi:hypothetical protein
MDSLAQERSILILIKLNIHPTQQPKLKKSYISVANRPKHPPFASRQGNGYDV